MEAKKSSEIPATRGMLEKLEEKLSHKTTAFELETKANFKILDAKIDTVDAKIGIVDAKIDTVDAKIEKVLEQISQTHLLIEDQKADNKYVLDGYASLHHKQEQTDERISTLEERVLGIKQK